MRNLITTVSLAVAVFIAQPIQAQYSGNDDTTKVQETLVEKPKNPEITTSTPYTLSKKRR